MSWPDSTLSLVIVMSYLFDRYLNNSSESQLIKTNFMNITKKFNQNALVQYEQYLEDRHKRNI